MASSSNGENKAPDCYCGGGRMKLLCAGKTSGHPGRMFYRCPFDMKHYKCFFWCDQYHQDDPAGTIPSYVLSQRWQINSGTNCETASSRPEDISARPVSSKRFQSDLEVLVGLLCVFTIIFCLGMVFGRLI